MKVEGEGSFMDQGMVNGLSTLLSNTPPRWVLKCYTDRSALSAKPAWIEICTTQKFKSAFRHEHPERSGVEASYILQSLRHFSETRDSSNLGVFSLILSVAQDYLHMDGAELRCRREEIVNWRLLTQQTGQSIFLCAFLAWSDRQSGYRRVDFSFSPYAKTDYLRLRHMLAQGMAENHFHLKGSAPSALLSWICLMNHIQNRWGDDGFGNRQFCQSLAQSIGDLGEDASTTKHGETRAADLYLLTGVAAHLRVLLWRTLNGVAEADEAFRKKEEQLRSHIKAVGTRRKASYNELHAILLSQVQKVINAERVLATNELDYLNNCQGQASEHVPYSALAGEHRFLYYAFRRLWEDPIWTERYGTLFYAYILIYIRFRRELIQCNDAYGFDNFQAYQNRKELFLNDSFQIELIRMAYFSALSNPSMRSVEARIVLHPSSQEMQRKLQRYTSLLPIVPEASNGFSKQKKDPRIFFVIHLPKRADVKLSKQYRNTPAFTPCRHHNYRNNYVWPQINALVSMFRNGNALVNRVFGLDACSQEIGCRPEVFAPAFRYARHLAVPGDNMIMTAPSPPTLRLTYHVGEDFLDVTDGLRAIDEAIQYLELRSGDRLGHALALGIDPEAWYEKRGYSMYLPAQDALDNVAWISRQLGRIDYADGRLREWLTTEYERLCVEIYGKPISPTVYYQAWLLRGDDPFYYIKKTVSEGAWRWKVSSDPVCHNLQKGGPARDLYWDYHFNPNVRYRGEQLIPFAPTWGYAKAIKAIQRMLQERIAHLGIGIETNPSSNFLINRFGRYDQHPIIVFNDTYLNNPARSLSLFVSINTDDQGVFDTDLENEFALMACALEGARDSEGHYLYAPEQVYRWLDLVRQMGVEQSFRYTNNGNTFGQTNELL